MSIAHEVEQVAQHQLHPFYRSWWGTWLSTVDHKRIGIMYLVAAAFFFVIGGIEAFLIRLQLMAPNNHILVNDVFNQVVTMHGTTMIFFVLMPMFLGYINCIVPLQLGARDVAFPFLNALSLWLFIAGGIILNSAWLFHQVPDDGWFAYAPLSTAQYNPGIGMDFYDLGVQISGVGTFITGVNFIVTVINMRCKGMSLRRMPLFTWAGLITAVMILFAFPALTVDLFLLMFDRLLGTNFFNVQLGGNVVVWQHLFWIFGHPEVYILVMPGFGMISEVVAAFARKGLFGYDSMVLALVAIAFLSFMVWSHHMFAVGMGPMVNSVFSVTTMLIAVPTGVKIFNWLATLWGGRIRLTTAMLYALGFIPIFVLGGVTGVMVAMAPADYQYNMSYFVVAHFHYVMIGGSLFALLAATFYWFPKIWGRVLDETLGKISFVLIFVGFNVTFFPMHFLGLMGMPRRIYTYKADLGLQFWNDIATYGLFILAAGFLVVLAAIIRAELSGRPAKDDPWDARTLEWSTTSPAPEYNFAQLPVVTTRDAWWHMKTSAGGRQGGDATPRGGGQADPEVKPSETASLKQVTRTIHMPAPTLQPLLMAFGLFVAVYGTIFSRGWVIGAGLAIAAYALYHGMFDRSAGIHIDPTKHTGEGTA